MPQTPSLHALTAISLAGIAAFAIVSRVASEFRNAPLFADFVEVEKSAALLALELHPRAEIVSASVRWDSQKEVYDVRLILSEIRPGLSELDPMPARSVRLDFLCRGTDCRLVGRYPE